MSDPYRVRPRELQHMLAEGAELAVVDVREEAIYARRHLLWATSVPLSRLELKLPSLVPRLGTPIVLCDEADGAAERALRVLGRLGYDCLSVLDGGIRAWEEAGLELFSGINVPSKAFGEFVEHSSRTPGISACELHQQLRSGADVIVLDSRPWDEYVRMSIPTAINVPGAELVLRIRDVVPSARTRVVVNCAGRTRSIIGAQSLIEAGLPNAVAALTNGTMGWELAGLTLQVGQNRTPPPLSPESLIWARSAADRVAARHGVPGIDAATLRAWQGERERTLYLFDVRSPDDYRTGHVSGAVSAPGGQLVQATDQYVAVRGARIVLIDDLRVRARMTAAWLRRMGWGEVAVLEDTGGARALRPPPIVSFADTRPEAALSPRQLFDLLSEDAATVIDLSRSTHYREGHIGGAWFVIRSRLAQAWPSIVPRPLLVLTSEDGRLAQLALPELSALTRSPVRWLRGGNAAWSEAGFPLVAGEERMADAPVDVWLRPYEERADPKAAMADYLAWETQLPQQIKRDGSCEGWR